MTKRQLEALERLQKLKEEEDQKDKEFWSQVRKRRPEIEKQFAIWDARTKKPKQMSSDSTLDPVLEEIGVGTAFGTEENIIMLLDEE